MLSGIIDFFSMIGDFISSIGDFLFRAFSDLVNFISVITQAWTFIPDVIDWFPASLALVLSLMIFIAVIFRIVGRE